jgi:hypothetical protein
MPDLRKYHSPKNHSLYNRSVDNKKIFESIITDGLLLYLDANNSISCNRITSDWYNLASSFSNMTMVNNPPLDINTPRNVLFNGLYHYGTSTGVTVPQTAYTKCVWFKLKSFDFNNNLVSSQVGGHFMFFATTNKLYCGHTNWFSYGLNFASYPSTRSFVLDTWYFATLTFDTANGMKLYVNGELDSTFTSGGSWNKNAHGGDGSTDIASYGGNNLLNGAISIVATYDRALTASEVLKNFQVTKRIFDITESNQPIPPFINSITIQNGSFTEANGLYSRTGPNDNFDYINAPGEASIYWNGSEWYISVLDVGNVAVNYNNLNPNSWLPFGPGNSVGITAINSYSS